MQNSANAIKNLNDLDAVIEVFNKNMVSGDLKAWIDLPLSKTASSILFGETPAHKSLLNEIFNCIGSKSHS